MPAKSKQQQKFMGLVHAYKKGEVPASKVSKSVKDAAKSMSNKSVKKYAKTKHDELPKKVTEKKERDYKAEYKKFQSSTKAKKYRAELNKYNRQKGTYGNGDGKDASHKGGKIVGFEAQSKNRGRKEKSRLKKESAFSVKIDTFQNAMKSLDKLSDILKKGGEKKKSMMVAKLVKQLQQAFFRKEIVENITEDITKLEKLAMNLLRNINKNAGVKNYDHNKTADFNKVVKFLKGKMPKVPNQRIGQIAMSYHDYRKKQPKIKIPDIDSVKDMEKTLKKLGMKEGVNERDNVGMAYKRTLAKVELKKIKDAIEMFQKRIKKQGSVTNARDEEHLKNLIKVYKGMGGKGIRESINEQQYFDPKGKLKKYMDKVLKQAGIRVIKYDPMKQSFYNGTWGGFYTVASSNKVDMPGQGKVKRSSAVLPVYIDKKGEVELGVSGDGFKLGKVGSSQVLKNLKDFKKGDLEESINEVSIGDRMANRRIQQIRKYFDQQYKTIKNAVERDARTGSKEFRNTDNRGEKYKLTVVINRLKELRNKLSRKDRGLADMFTKNITPIEKVKDKMKEGTCGYGLDGNLGEEPAGPHLIKKKKKKIKENKQEKLQIAKTILSQLGGNRFVAMTGAKSFGYDSKGSSVSLQFRIGRNAKQVNIVKINYIRGKDLYEMEFYKGTKLLKKVSNVYADQLRKIFTKHTGMYTSL